VAAPADSLGNSWPEAQGGFFNAESAPMILTLPKILSLHFLFQAVFSMKSNWALGCNPVIGAWLINALSD
jgi:hypothetical protein